MLSSWAALGTGASAGLTGRSTSGWPGWAYTGLGSEDQTHRDAHVLNEDTAADSRPDQCGLCLHLGDLADSFILSNLQPIMHTFTTGGGVNHAGRQPVRREQSG